MSLHLNTKSLNLFPDIARRGRDVGSMASMFKLEANRAAMIYPFASSDGGYGRGDEHEDHAACRRSMPSP